MLIFWYLATQFKSGKSAYPDILAKLGDCFRNNVLDFYTGVPDIGLEK